MKYVIYTRVSDVKQEDGTSPETQLEDCLTLVGNAAYIHIHDTAKGWLPIEKRPRLLKAIGELEAGDILLCRSPDRLSRDNEEIGAIKSLVRKNKATINVFKGSLKSENMSAHEWLVQTMLAALPEYEVRLLGERIDRAYTKKKEANEAMGYARYGYKSEKGKVIKDEERQRVLQQMIRMKKKGKSIREIVQSLNDAEIYNTVGKPWAYESVRRILNQELAESQSPPAPV